MSMQKLRVPLLAVLPAMAAASIPAVLNARSSADVVFILNDAVYWPPSVPLS